MPLPKRRGIYYLEARADSEGGLYIWVRHRPVGGDRRRHSPLPVRARHAVPLRPQGEGESARREARPPKKTRTPPVAGSRKVT